MIAEIFNWLYHYGPWVLLFLTIGAMFTNGFGMLDNRKPKGSWYPVSLENLNTVCNNLHKNNAFMDSDGVLQSEDLRIVPVYSPHISFEYEIYVPDYCLDKVGRSVALKNLGLNID